MSPSTRRNGPEPIKESSFSVETYIQRTLILIALRPPSTPTPQSRQSSSPPPLLGGGRTRLPLRRLRRRRRRRSPRPRQIPESLCQREGLSSKSLDLLITLGNTMEASMQKKLFCAITMPSLELKTRCIQVANVTERASPNNAAEGTRRPRLAISPRPSDFIGFSRVRSKVQGCHLFLALMLCV